MLVGAVVVHDQVHLQILGVGLLDLSEVTQEFLVTVAGLALGDHLPSGDIQGSRQGGRPGPIRSHPEEIAENAGFCHPNSLSNPLMS